MYLVKISISLFLTVIILILFFDNVAKCLENFFPYLSDNVNRQPQQSDSYSFNYFDSGWNDQCGFGFAGNF